MVWPFGSRMAFMMEIGNGVGSSGYQLLGYPIGVGLADNVAGQVDFPNHLLIRVVPKTARTCPSALRDHQEGGSQHHFGRARCARFAGWSSP